MFLQLFVDSLIICISWMIQKCFLPSHFPCCVPRASHKSRDRTMRQFYLISAKRQSFCVMAEKSETLWTLIMPADGSNAINSKTFRPLDLLFRGAASTQNKRQAGAGRVNIAKCIQNRGKLINFSFFPSPSPSSWSVCQNFIVFVCLVWHFLSPRLVFGLSDLRI